ITPIEKGGSDRRFYRVRTGPENTLILVKYNRERAENRLYVRVAEFLADNGICAPKIYFHDEGEGLIWIEDLGEKDLWSHRERAWTERRALYRSALEQIARLHSLPHHAADGIRDDLPAEFDAPLYAWEQQYFFENCLARHFNLAPELLAELSASPMLTATAERLASLPRVLVHRDFQSQNIVVRDGRAHLIDFQGMRPGLAEYDLASLLYDPYVQLQQTDRDELCAIYRDLRADTVRASCAEDEDVFRLCAMQRLMQALGAYGYLGHVRGNAAFLGHIPAALDSLCSVTAGVDGAEPLYRLLVTLQ
ncbi:MAG: aminoglycoside phosphotransferase family protein, partial [Chthoniobacterales bacterium]